MKIMSTKRLVYMCADTSHENSGEYLGRVSAALREHGFEGVIESMDFVERFFAKRAVFGNALLFLGPVSPETLKELRSKIGIASSYDDESFKGVILIHTPVSEFGSVEVRHLFGDFSTLGLHFAHPELANADHTICEPQKIADLLLCKTKHTRYVSNQLGQSIPKDVVSRNYGYFKSAITQIFAFGMFNGLEDGSLSMRIDSRRILCTATKTGKMPHTFTPDRLVLIESFDPATNTIDWVGTRAPSSSSPWHAMLYNVLPDVQAVVHTHSRFMTYSSSPDALAVRSSRYIRYGEPAVFESVRHILEKNNNRVAILQGHGEVAVGSSLQEALDAAISLKTVVEKAYRGPM